jgi:hypothetical protein
MTKEFIDRVIREGIVDTKTYRYIRKDMTGATEQWVEIRRLPIDKLDTTAAIDGWETVRVIK